MLGLSFLVFSGWVLVGNEESLRSPEMVWLFDGLAVEDMIGEVRKKKKKKKKNQGACVREKLGGCFVLILS
jgi:hypothetical protein